MERNNTSQFVDSWGINPYDQVCGGLPKGIFNLLRSCSEEVDIVAIGHFLKAGIDRGENVSLVCFDHPTYLLEKFKAHGFNFDNALYTEQMVYLYYKPFFSHALNLATNYRQLFDEAINLSKGNINRIAFLSADVLFNLETYLLAEVSAQKIMECARNEDFTILGSYHATDIRPHRHLDQVGQSLLTSFLEIAAASHEGERRYKLILHRSPMPYDQSTIELLLVPGSGFRFPNIELIKYG